MKDVAWGRLILAGLGAGLVFNAGGMLSAWLSALPESFARFGVAPSASAALVHVSLRLLLGLASVLLYTGVRRSWGHGLASAWRIGLLVWFVGYVPGSVVLHEVGVLTDGQLAFALPWGLAESVAATCVGALLYR